MSVFSKLTAIADNIRAKTGGTDALTLDQMATSINEVYNKGKDKGAFDEWDTFWSAFQDYGWRRDYRYAFNLWYEVMFKPKFKIIPIWANAMFRNALIVDLKGILEECNVTLDTSQTEVADYMFVGCKQMTRIPELDMSKSTKCEYMFQYCNSLISVDKLIVNANVGFVGAFEKCYELQTIIFEGTIGKSINLSESEKLTYESLMSIINCLKDYSTDTSGTVYTLTIGETNQAKLTSEEIAIATGKGWTVA